MRLSVALVALLIIAVAVNGAPQRVFTQTRDATVPFVSGETLTYDVSWSNLLTAGTAVTQVVQQRPSLGASAWEITAHGTPIPLIQRLYPVYYKMDTLLESASLLSQWTGLYMDENGRKRQTSMRFDRPTRKVLYEMTTPTAARAELVAPVGIQDGLALLYALRTRVFRNGEHFTIPVADDGSLYAVEFGTSGPERVTTKLGTADAWNLSVAIKNAAKQQIGNNIGVWISTDPRRLPVKIQAELPAGNFILALRDVK